MTSRPRVSFVVPAFNEERLLPTIRAEIARSGCPAEVQGGNFVLRRDVLPASAATETGSRSTARTPTSRAA